MTESKEGTGSSGDPESSGGAGRRKKLLSTIIRTTKQTATSITPGEASMKARICRGCGAARPEGTDLRVCGYCGDIFMTGGDGSAVDGSRSSTDS